MARIPKKQCYGSWAKAIPVAAGGAVSVTIPAGIFSAAPVVKHTVQSTAARDYVFRLSAATFNADKSVTVAGVIRESRTLPAVLTLLSSLAGFDPYQALSTAVTLHLSAEESD